MTDLDDLSPEEVVSRYRRHTGTLTDLVASRAEVDPAREMLLDSERSWTWAEGIDEAARLAGSLHRLGVGRDDRVVVFAANSGWHVLTLLACARLGSILVPANPDLGGDALAYVLGLAAPQVVLVADQRAGRTVSDALPGARIRVLGPALLDAEPFTEDPGDPDGGAIIIFTSGTTGFPKGALHSQRTLLLSGEGFIARVHLQPTDRLLTILPLFHVNAMFYSVAGALAAGATLVVEPRFSASRFWRTVVERRVSQANMIEAVGAILLKRSEEEFHPTHSLRRIYGVREALAEQSRARFEVPHIVGGYGMTEIPGILATPYDGPTPPGSMGRLGRLPGSDRPLADCRIVDEAGRDVPDGSVGELYVRTPTVMLGYYRDPEQTAAAFDGDWFRTGDLVRRDSEGWYYFVSRKKDIIRVRGENISGAEIDRVATGHPDVVLAAAVGVPAELGDEDILLAITVREGARLTPEELAAYCAESMISAGRPRYVLIVCDLPLTASGKVAKHLLRADPTLRERAIDTLGPAASGTITVSHR